MFGLGLGRMGLVGDLGFAIRRALFGNGEQGMWYDLNDLSTLFTDSAGTTPATWGDPIGRVLDKSGNGNHRIQSTAGSRLILGRMPKAGVRNLSRRTQEFDNAWWSKVGSTVTPNQSIAPDNTSTMDKLVENTATSAHGVQASSSAVASGLSYTFSIYAKASERSFIRITGNAAGLVGAAFYDTSTGNVGTVAAGTTATMDNVGNGIYRCNFTRTTTSASNVEFLVSVTSADNVSSYLGDGTSGIFIWGAQLEQSATATNYQHVIDSLGFNITESGQPSCGYLSYNGSNQWMQTAAAVNFSATDEMSVFAGVRKNVEGTAGFVCEHTTSSAGPASFGLAMPTGAAANSFNYTSSGSATAANALANSLPSPVSAVITCLSEISADTNTTRRNGVLVQSVTTDQGTGNYANAVTYFGARAGTSLYFNGLEFSSIIRGALTSGTLLTRTEQYVADRTPTIALAPVNTVAPVISGTTESGETLTSTSGTFTGGGTLSYFYQWKRGVTNVGTNANTYVLTDADISFNITCQVTASSAYGGAVATSNSLGPVTAAPADVLAFSAGTGAGYANGDGSTADNTSFAEIGTVPKNDWAMLAARQQGGHGIDRSGNLYAWGNSLTTGTGGLVTDLTLMTAPGDWAYVAAGGSIACAIKTNGTLWGWGSGLGAGTGAAANTAPTQVGSATDWATVDIGGTYGGGIRTGGELYMWGENGSYQLGDNTTTQRNTPVQIGVATDWAQVSCGALTHTMAVKTDGTLWGWGATTNGRLGVAAGVPLQVPTQIGSDTNWSKVQCGSTGSVGLKTDGTIWAIGGLNAQGELGVGSTSAVTTITQIGSDTDWSDISLALLTLAAIKTNGDVYFCGVNSGYQYGNTVTTSVTSLQRTTSVTNCIAAYPDFSNTCILTEP